MSFEIEFNYVLRLNKEDISLDKLILGASFDFTKMGSRIFDDKNPILLQDKDLEPYAIVMVDSQTRKGNVVSGKYIVRGLLSDLEKEGLRSYWKKVNSIINSR